VILLGASNLTLGLSSLIATAQLAWGAPLEIMAAVGHGRSYGTTSSVLGRALPGIVECGLWHDLRQRPPLPTAALVSDIGNDLLYGQPVDTILFWLTTCLERLCRVSDRLVITRLPLASIEQVPAWRMRLLISLVFPRSRCNVDLILARARELDGHLLSFAGRFGAYVVAPERTWYGWDPIHVAGAYRAVAWQKFLSRWTDGKSISAPSPSLRRWITTRGARPLRWQLCGFARHRRQPAARFPDGSTLSLY
jgi:hypothetical protein